MSALLLLDAVLSSPLNLLRLQNRIYANLYGTCIDAADVHE